MCQSPMNYYKYAIRNMAEEYPDYYCPLSMTPYNEYQIPDWDVKQYNPHCRTWYNGQRRAGTYNYVSDIYEHAQVPKY